MKHPVTHLKSAQVWIITLALLSAFSCAQPNGNNPQQGFNPNLPPPQQDFPSLSRTSRGLTISSAEWQAMSGQYQARIEGLQDFSGAFTEQVATIEISAALTASPAPTPRGTATGTIAQIPGGTATGTIGSIPASTGRLAMQTSGELGNYRIQSYLAPNVRMAGESGGLVHYEFHTSRIPRNQLSPWIDEDVVVYFYVTLTNEGGNRYRLYNNAGYEAVARLIGCGLSSGSSVCSGFGPGYSQFSGSLNRSSGRYRMDGRVQPQGPMSGAASSLRPDQ